ncbi:MAG: hypothetical protein FWG91_09590 [Lachnospiraceae bacterium]|nr:hypothetical protein [Lachnospiraceae bacterium]
MKRTRIDYIIKNLTTGLFAQVLSLGLAFFSRKVLIVTLGNEYLSLNGLFSSILTVLSLAELGFGGAIIYSLYKPLATSDNEKIKSLMYLYKRAYRLIALIVFAIGIIFMPFIKMIINREPDIPENIYFIFFLFLINSVSSYFFAYRRSIISASQANYLISRVNIASSILLTGTQIIILLVFQNFILYFLMNIIINILSNIYISRLAEKLYPIIKEKNIAPLPEETKQDIKVNVKSLILYKTGSLLGTGLDNMIISYFVSFASVGIYSNYLLITKGVNSLLSTVFQSATASIGNLNALSDTGTRERIYRSFLFIAFWLYGFTNIAFFNLLNPFIKLVFGEFYLFGEEIVLTISLSGFLFGLHQPTMAYRNTMGLYRYGRLRPVLGAILNVILSLLLVNPLGVLGVLLGTLGSRIFLLSWFEPRINYKFGLKMPPAKFFSDYVRYAIVFMLTAFIAKWAVMQVQSESIMAFLLKILITIVVPNVVFLLLFRKSEHFIYLINAGKDVLKRKFRQGEGQ